MIPQYKNITEALAQLRFCEYTDKLGFHKLEMNVAFQYLEQRAKEELEAIAEIEQLRQEKAELEQRNYELLKNEEKLLIQLLIITAEKLPEIATKELLRQAETEIEKMLERSDTK